MLIYEGNNPIGFGKFERDRVNASRTAIVLAADRIVVGDTVHVIGEQAYPLVEGKITSLPYESRFGFAVSDAEAGALVTIRTIGKVATDFDITPEIEQHRTIMANIDAALEDKARPPEGEGKEW